LGGCWRVTVAANPQSPIPNPQINLK